MIKESQVGFKSLISEVLIQAREANPVSNSQRVLGELGISQSSIVYHFHNLSKVLDIEDALWHAMYNGVGGILGGSQMLGIRIIQNLPIS